MKGDGIALPPQPLALYYRVKTHLPELGGRTAGQCRRFRLLRERADLSADAQVVDRAERMLAHLALLIDQNQAGRAAHLVAVHGVRYRTRRVRLIERNGKLQAVF